MVEPKVRFKRDDGSSFPKWINCQFMSLIERIIDFRGRTPKKLGMEWVEEKTDYIALSALNVKSGYIDFSADPHYGDKRLYEKWMSGNELRKGQVLFTTEAPMGNVAQVPDDKPYILSQRTIAFNVIENKINEGYLSYLLLSPNVQTALSQLATGGTATGVSQKSLVKLFVTIPSSLNEQQKIADFLFSVDEVIAVSEQEVANLEMQKKAVMKKIFSQEVRFKREDGTDFPEWEEKKLGDIIANITSVKRIHAEDWRDSGVPFYRAREIVALFNKEPISPLFIDEELYEEFSAISGKIKEGDLLVTGVGTIGIPYLVKKEDRFYFKDGNIIWIQNNGNISGKYLYMLYGTPYMTSQLINMSGKGTVHTYTIENAKRTVVPFPCLEEQHLIADFLSDFDDAIAAAKKELELWKELKKGLLQQMFI